MIRRIARVAVLVALAAVAGGCGAAGWGGPGPARVPAALPADVPLPERAVLRTARDQGRKGITLVFEAAEPLAAVDARLRARLQQGGWVLLSEAALENAVFTSYRKSGRSVALGVSRTGEVTVVGLSYRLAAPPGEGDQG
jgi:hypothetical protein